MTGAGLPPIALEAVRKILAIGQDSATSKKTVRRAEKPKFRLELTSEAATMASPVLPRRAARNTRTIKSAMPRRRPVMPTPTSSRAGAEGAESC